MPGKGKTTATTTARQPSQAYLHFVHAAARALVSPRSTFQKGAKANTLEVITR